MHILIFEADDGISDQIIGLKCMSCIVYWIKVHVLYTVCNIIGINMLLGCDAKI